MGSRTIGASGCEREWERRDRRGHPPQRRVGRRASCGHAARALARERLVETKLTAGRERRGPGLRLAYRVAQVCHADARGHRRVAEDGRRAGEVVKESNPGAEQNRRDINADFVEEAGIQESGRKGVSVATVTLRANRLPYWLYQDSGFFAPGGGPVPISIASGCEGVAMGVIRSSCARAGDASAATSASTATTK
jgi:hypothetical protein